jgi:uncharacterized protein YfeS
MNNRSIKKTTGRNYFTCSLTLGMLWLGQMLVTGKIEKKYSEIVLRAMLKHQVYRLCTITKLINDSGGT